MNSAACPIITGEKRVLSIDPGTLERFLSEVKNWTEELAQNCDNPDYANPKRFLVDIVARAGEIVRLAKRHDSLRDDIGIACIDIAASAYFVFAMFADEKSITESILRRVC